MKREDLIKSKGYNITKIQNELFRQLHEYLKTNNITQTQFAKDLGVTKGYVSQILNGDFDFKLSKLVELSLAMGKIPEVKFKNIDENEKKDSGNFKLTYLTEHRLKNQSEVAESTEVYFKNNIDSKLFKITK
ncbi:MAG: helix-turn-helix transcriptional regulator [Bacteroidales bacterium]|nr:helix-turn-helix transcriptional regulator [Bacteroidales bacterium]